MERIPVHLNIDEVMKQRRGRRNALGPVSGYENQIARARPSVLNFNRRDIYHPRGCRCNGRIARVYTGEIPPRNPRDI